ncbi:hypothetical protein CTI14_00255 [Methylobacterium radiotolerans]|nr:hypothetical protein CTI14_00255 [Methylobacterium radiotolerans]
MPLRFWVSPSSGLTGSPKILLIGDSLTNRRIGAFLNAKLMAMGLTPTFLGTMPSAGLTDTDWGNATGGPLGEGREGWQFADFIYQNTRFDPIGQAGQTTVAQYSAMTKGGMNGKNPFVIPSGAGANVYNGYKFDFPTYLSRFGIARPTSW